MLQPALFESPPVVRKRLEVSIEREDNRLLIPEGLQTIPCTHGIHRFPGKFIPNLPRYLFRSVFSSRESKVVLDPFCGSGTTAVEAALEGRPFIGIDIDPLAVAISNVKVFPLSDGELCFLEKCWSKHDYEQEQPSLIPNAPNLTHWFRDRTIKQLSSVKAACLQLPGRTQLFSLVVFSSIIRRVSNADDQTQKTYVSHTRRKEPPLVSALFPIFLKRAIDGMRQYLALLPELPKGRIYRADARLGIEGGFDDVITSPPYVDSIDYIYNQMLEYFWLMPELGVNSYEELRRFRKKPMGFRVLDGKTELTSRFGRLTSVLDSICSSVGQVSLKEAALVRSFFSDFVEHLAAIKKAQSPEGYYVCIVSNSVIRGIVVPTVDILTGIFQDAGYCLRDKLRYEIRRHYMKFPRKNNSGKITDDCILIFQLPK